MGSDVDGASIAPDTRSIAEFLAERLDAGLGHWTLEFTYEDGTPSRPQA